MWKKDRERALGALREQLVDTNARLERLESAPASDGRVTNLEELATAQDARLDDLQTKIKDLTFAVSEGIERTDRAERRVRGVIARARKELAARGYEDPGLEAEDQELRIVNGDGGQDQQLPPVSEDVAPSAEESSSIRGVPASVLRRKWGM